MQLCEAAGPCGPRFLLRRGKAGGALRIGRRSRQRDRDEPLLRRMRPRLEPSPILFEFLHILLQAPILPPALNAAQSLLVRAALAVVPPWIRTILGIGDEWLPGPVETRIVKAAAAVAGRYRIDTSPPALACVRLGLPADYLHQRSF